jgi:hypothetical protein
MRQWIIGGAVLAAAMAGPGRAHAQGSPFDWDHPGVARGQSPANPGFDPPLNTEPTIPIPTGRAGSAGFYATAEYVMLTQNRAIGEQTIAIRGLFDSTGLLTGNAGGFLGSGADALNTRELGRTTYMPGFQVELGYRFDDGTRLYANYLQLFDAHYSAGASLVPRGFAGGTDLSNTFISAPVYNFTPQYSGPATKIVPDLPGVGSRTILQSVVQGATITVQQGTVGGIGNTPPPPIIITTPIIGQVRVSVPANQIVVTRPTTIGAVTAVNGNTGALLSSTPVIVDQPQGVAGGNPGFNAYGIWNAASVMDIKFTQRYQQAEMGVRVPIFQTDYSRVYGIGGGKFAWFFERFAWRTVSADASGTIHPSYAADYTNTLSQRLYGPMVGAGHEIFLANQFSLSCDLTGALLLGVVKARMKYELGDESTQAKRGRNDFKFIPNLNANLNLWWYPIEGVQVRVGYNALTYFNTERMDEPVGFNYGAIDPKYDTQWFRLLHGVNVGVGLFF